MSQLIAGMSADQEAASLQALQAPSQQGNDKTGLCQWQRRADGDGLELVHQHSVSHVTWHARGDYFASVAPAGNTQVSPLSYSKACHMRCLLLKRLRQSNGLSVKTTGRGCMIPSGPLTLSDLPHLPFAHHPSPV